MSQWELLKERASGKWQLPLLALSVVMLVGAFLRARPTPTNLPLDQALTHLERLVGAGSFDQAVEIGERLLIREQGSDADSAPIHLQLARARYGLARRHGTQTADIGRQIIEHYRQAGAPAPTFAPDDFEHMGRALELQGHYSDAVEQYEAAVERGVRDALDVRRRALTLELCRLHTPAETLRQKLQLLLDKVGDDRLSLRLWAIERLLEVYATLDRLDSAATLMARNRQRFQTSDLRDRYNYWEAWLLYRTGHYDEAETRLRTVRNRVDRADQVHAMTGWLLGRVIMSDGGPQRPLEAASFFSDVVGSHLESPYAVASYVGLAEAMAMLERHDKAIDAYRVAIEELPALGDQRLVNLDVLRASLAVMAETQRVAGRLREAVAYARLAAGLADRENVEQATRYLQQLAQLLSSFATRVDDQPADAPVRSDRPREASRIEARGLFADAGATYLEVARLNILNEQVSTAASWQAAEAYAKAGQRDRAAGLYRTFATERPHHPLVPRALLRIGQLRQTIGELAAAIEAYQTCYREFPRTLDGARALVPLAQCYLAAGPDYDDLAEKTLQIVLAESEVFTPQAPEFADALFLLGEALNRRGDFERAIATIEEALTRYPDDPRVWRARFLLADSFRQSGLGLKAEVARARHPGEIELLRAESTARFQAAQRLYRELIDEYELRGAAALNRLEQAYLRHAHLYEADCYFETQDYRRALKLYEEAVGIYRGTPSALAAYVQIINSYVFLSEPDEARAALARAMVLVDGMPDEAFDRSASPEGRGDWKRYFEWLGACELF